MGIVDALFPPERLLSESLAKAGELGNLPAEAFGAIKANRTGEWLKRSAAVWRKIFSSMIFWYCKEARGRLKEAMKKF